MSKGIVTLSRHAWKDTHIVKLLKVMFLIVNAFASSRIWLNTIPDISSNLHRFYQYKYNKVLLIVSTFNKNRGYLLQKIHMGPFIIVSHSKGGGGFSTRGVCDGRRIQYT